MQSFTTIPSTQTVKTSLTPLMNNDGTLLSCSEGTAFPTTGVVIGQLCLRSDQGKLYQCKDLTGTGGGPTWVLIANLASGIGTAAALNVGTGASQIPQLDGSGKLPTAVLPALAITDTFVVASQAAMLALTAQTGDVAIRTDLSETFILQGSDPTVLANWQQILAPAAAVLSVNGKTGALTLSLASSDFANQGTAHGILHGNAAGNPSWGSVDLTSEVSGVLPTANGGVPGSGTAHVVLHGDASWGAIALTTEVSGYLPTANGGIKSGGTTGQMPRKASGTDGDVVWEDVPVDCPFYFDGVPTASQKQIVHITRGFTLAANCSGSYGRGTAASTGTVSFDVQRSAAGAAFATIATVTFTAASTATFTTPSGAVITLAADDRIKVVSPGTPDATLADISIVFKLVRT